MNGLNEGRQTSPGARAQHSLPRPQVPPPHAFPGMPASSWCGTAHKNVIKVVTVQDTGPNGGDTLPLCPACPGKGVGRQPGSRAVRALLCLQHMDTCHLCIHGECIWQLLARKRACDCCVSAI